MALRIRLTSLTVLASLVLVSPCLGVKPAESLLPDTTCLYVSFVDMDQFRHKFEATQIGKLANDPVMKPFAEDLGSQLRDRFGDTDVQLGLKWDDLEGVYAGEACLARIQPAGEKGQHATALLIDVTDKQAQVEKVKASIATNMETRGAKSRQQQIGGVDVTVYQLKKEIGRKPREVFMTVVDDHFVLVNHIDEATGIIERIKEDVEEGTLRQSKSFVEVMQSVSKEAKELAPDVRWFVDPFTYADVVRSARGPKKKRRKDLRQLLENQGFDAIRAMGGHINLATKEYEFLHRTSVYAPAVTAEPTRYNKAARMLDFPASTHLPVPAWIPRKLSTFSSFNWKIRTAFEYSISLIDEYVGSENFVEDVLEDFETAKGGPMIDIRKDLLDYLDEHVMTVSDYELPISTKSERVLVAIKVKDENQVRDSLQRLWQDGKDPTVNKREYDGHVIWEVVPAEEEDLNLQLPLPAGAPVAEEKVQLGGPVPNAAMTVSRGFFLVSTHLDYLQTILDDREPFDALDSSADFTHVNARLDALGGGTESFRFFSRTDEEYRSAYEMIRQGKMPESESMLGRVLNKLLGTGEDGVVRKPELDGSKMPPYQVVRRYLGPAGAYVVSRPDGWFVTGIVVSKEKLVDKKVNAQNPLTASRK